MSTCPPGMAKSCGYSANSWSVRPPSVVNVPPGPPGAASGVKDSRRPLSDRKSTRLNSSHANISYAVFWLKKKMHLDLVLVFAVGSAVAKKLGVMWRRLVVGGALCNLRSIRHMLIKFTFAGTRVPVLDQEI